MTEHEKIFAGKLFNARGAELKAVKHKAHNLCTEYNSLMEDDPRRTEILREMLGGMGETSPFRDRSSSITVCIPRSAQISLPIITSSSRTMVV